MVSESIADTIIAKSDQLNADDLMGGPMRCTVKDVRRLSSADQPVAIDIDTHKQPYKPNKTMRRILIFAWGDKPAEWIGRQMVLVRNPHVKWAGEEVGGIEISHLSDMDEEEIHISLQVTRGKKKPFSVKRLGAQRKPAYDLDKNIDDIRSAIESGERTPADVIEKLSDRVELTDEQKQRIESCAASDGQLFDTHPTDT